MIYVEFQNINGWTETVTPHWDSSSTTVVVLTTALRTQGMHVRISERNQDTVLTVTSGPNR